MLALWVERVELHRHSYAEVQLLVPHLLAQEADPVGGFAAAACGKRSSLALKSLLLL